MNCAAQGAELIRARGEELQPIAHVMCSADRLELHAFDEMKPLVHSLIRKWLSENKTVVMVNEAYMVLGSVSTKIRPRDDPDRIECVIIRLFLPPATCLGWRREIVQEELHGPWLKLEMIADFGHPDAVMLSMGRVVE